MTSPPGPDDEGAADRWETLARYLAGESPPHEVETLERWLAEEPRRQGMLDALHARLDRLAAAPPPGLDVEAALAGVRSRLHEPEAGVIGFQERVRRRQEQGVPRPRRTLLKAAALLALALGGSLVWQALSVNAPPAPELTYATAVGQTDSVTLADGTRVQLGPDTRLTVAAGYGEEIREVHLVGEAHFEVLHDPVRPFLLQAGAARIEDLGTAFAARAAGDGEVRVVVTEGSLRFSARSGLPTSAVVLQAGDRGRLLGDEAPVVERAAATEADLAWTRGQLVFQDATISRVVTDLRRWYGVEVRLGDAALADRHVTTMAFEGEGVQEVLRVIALALGVDWQMRGDTALIGVESGLAP
jgi:transmembrane sensor